MTIYDAYEKLLEFFAVNDFFDLEKDYLKLGIITDYSQEDNKEIVKQTLSSMEKDGIIVKISNENKWVLVKKLNQFKQNVEISGSTAIHISNILNYYAEYLKHDGLRCFAMNISERDILNLVEILIIKNKQESENENEE